MIKFENFGELNSQHSSQLVSNVLRNINTLNGMSITCKSIQHLKCWNILKL